MLLAAVYLQPSDVPLLTGAQYADVAATPRVAMAAPIAFGDSVEGAPVVGTIAAFVTHLSGDPAEGRVFGAEGEAVVGAYSPLRVGDTVEPAHGSGPAADTHAHAGEGRPAHANSRKTSNLSSPKDRPPEPASPPSAPGPSPSARQPWSAQKRSARRSGKSSAND